MSLPEWLSDGRRDNNRRSRRQERRHAKATGGKVQPGSGSSPRARGDVKGAEYLDELKFTDKASYSLSVQTWKKIESAAAVNGLEPRLIIEFPQHNLTLEVVRRG